MGPEQPRRLPVSPGNAVACSRALALAASRPSPGGGHMPGRLISGARELSLTQLSERVERAASAFASIGIGRGDGVALMLRNDFAFFEAAGGARARAGRSAAVDSYCH